MIIMCQRQHGHFVGRENLKVALSEDYNRKTLPPEHELEISDVWEEKVRRNPSLYNGTKFRLDSIVGNACSENIIFNLGITCYKDFIGTNWSPNAKQFHVLGSSKCGNSQAYLSDALGVGALLETKDNFAVFLKRSMLCAEAPGLWDIPGGHPEPKVLVGKKSAEEIEPAALSAKEVVDEIFNSTLLEIINEVNVPHESLTDPMLIGVARNTTSAGRPSSEYYVRCILSSDEIRTLYHKGTQEEADESNGIMFLPISELSSLEVMRNDIWCQLAPSAKGCILLFASAFNKTCLD